MAGLNLERLALLSSPLQRETAAALEQRWNAVALADARVGEIQSPGVTPEPRKDWLRDILLRRWSELGQPHDRWRSNVLERAWE